MINRFAILRLAAFASVIFMGLSASSDVAQDVAGRIRQAPPTHPRLFFADNAAPGLKAKIEGDALLSPVYNRLKAAADVLLTQEPVKRQKIGKRLLGVSRTCLQRVSYLAFAYRMTGDERYLKRAEQEMLAAAAFEDWNPSHFLDVGEMTAALGIGYDWLYNDLSDGSRKAIREAIVNKGLEVSKQGGNWVKGANNWNQVCHGGLVLGALAVYEEHRELAEFIITRAVENVPYATRACAPDGVYPEGPSYWEYGTTYNVLMIAALESVLGCDFELSKVDGFLKTPDFYLRATGPTGLYFNYADCGAHGSISPAMHWFAKRRNDPTLLWHEKDELRRFAQEKPTADGSGNRMLAFLLIWGQPVGEVSEPQTLHWKGDGPTPIAMLCSSWQGDATYAGLKGGSPSSGHAHMDIGSFVLDMKGVRWAVDLGSQGYNGLESRGIDLWNRKQDSERWTVFRLGSLSHNTLVVDGQLQRVAGNGIITRFSDNPARPFAVLDMSSVYEGQLAHAARGLRFIGESVLVQDQIRTLDRAASVRWAMTTHAEVALGEKGLATLRQDGRTVSLRVLSPANARLAIYEAEKPPRDYDEANPNTRMVGFEATVPASTDETWTVLIEPNNPMENTQEVVRLEEW